jgi:hypothetical protein
MVKMNTEFINKIENIWLRRTVVVLVVVLYHLVLLVACGIEWLYKCVAACATVTKKYADDVKPRYAELIQTLKGYW